MAKEESSATMAQVPPMSKFPPEVIAFVLGFLDNTRDLKNALLSHGCFLRAWRSRRQAIARSMLRSAIPDDIMILALAAEKAKAYGFPPMREDNPAREAAEFTETEKARIREILVFVNDNFAAADCTTSYRLPASAVSSLGQVRSMLQLHRVVRLAEDTVAESARRDRPRSARETYRIQRALYRYELWGRLFSEKRERPAWFLYRPPTPLPDFVPYDFFAPWSLIVNEQFACVETIVHLKIWTTLEILHVNPRGWVYGDRLRPEHSLFTLAHLESQIKKPVHLREPLRRHRYIYEHHSSSEYRQCDYVLDRRLLRPPSLQSLAVIRSMLPCLTRPNSVPGPDDFQADENLRPSLISVLHCHYFRNRLSIVDEQNLLSGYALWDYHLISQPCEDWSCLWDRNVEFPSVLEKIGDLNSMWVSL